MLNNEFFHPQCALYASFTGFIFLFLVLGVKFLKIHSN